jgi:dTDP-4-amino-4,6-dideoxygalactose transaminase
LVFERYREALSDIADICWMPEPEGFQSTRWLSCFALAGKNATARCHALMTSMERHSIEVRPIWKPMHLQPLFHDAPYFPHAGGNDVSCRLFESGVCLPSGSNLSEEQQDRVVTHVRRVLTSLEP